MFRAILRFLVRAVPAILFLGLFIWLYNYLVSTKPEVIAEPRQEQVWTVSATIAEQRDAAPILTAYGTVAAARSADLRFGSAGEVSSISVDMRNGVSVAAGDVLGQLDDVRYQLALEEVEVQISGEERNIASLEKQIILREKSLLRTKQMVERQVASASALDEAELALTIAENQLILAKSRLAQLQVARKSRQQDIDDSILRAPFAGTLSNVSIGLGKRVSNAAAVAVLTDPTSLEVPFTVPAEIFANVSSLVGQIVDVTWRTGGTEVARVAATITRAEAIVDKREGGGQLYAVLESGKAAIIPPGAFVEVRFVGKVLEDVFELPEEALVNNDKVFVILDGKTEMRTVRAEYRAGGSVWVSGALQAGDNIVSSRLPGIGPGMRVRVTSTSGS